MTHELARTGSPGRPHEQPDSPSGEGPGRPQPPPGKGSYGQVRVWLLALAISTAVVFAYILPPYLGLDPSKATVPLPEAFPAKYAVLVLHIVFGSVALVTLCLQVWPWLRERHPAAHRVSGRLYVLAGVLPSVALSWYLLVTSYGGPGWVGRAALSALWFLTTVMGFVRGRQKQYAAHRRFMIYSFALTMDALSSRAVANLLLIVVGLPPGEVPTDQAASFVTAAETSAWCGWLLNLVIAAWWLDGRRTKPRRLATTAG